MIVVVAFVIAVILIAVMSNPATRLCRWREYPDGETSTWRCAACGARTTGPRGKAPKMCLRNTG